MPYPDIQRRSRRGRTSYGGGTSVLTRYFTDYDASLQSYDEFSTPITLTGDFEVELDYVGDGDNFRELVGSVSNDRLLRIDAGGVARAYAGLVSVTGTTDVTDGKVHKIGSRRVGTTLSLYVDNALEGQLTNAAVAGSMTINTLMRHLSLYLNGTPSNFKVWTNGDRNTGTLVGDFPLDEGPDSTIRINRAAVLGSELTVDNVPAGWTDNGDGSYNWASDENSSDFELGIGDVALNDTILVEYTVSDYSGAGSFRLSTSTSTDFSKTIISGNGSVSAIVQVDGSIPDRVKLFSRSTNTLTLSNIRIQVIPAATPYATRFNQPASQDNLFTRVSGRWVGPTVWNDPPSSIGSQWLDLGGGRYQYTGDGSFNALLDSPVYSVGDVARTTFNVESISGEMRVFSGATLGVFNSIGPTTIDGTTTDTFIGFARNFGVVSCVIGNIESRRLLEEA